MFTIQVLLVIFCLCCILRGFDGRPIEYGGVKLVDTKTIELILPDKLSFNVPATCTGTIFVCYETSETLTTDSNNQFYNTDVAHHCPPNNCILTYEVERGNYPIVKIESSSANKIATFDDEATEYCGRKTINSRQNLTVVQLPNCEVTVVGASLPKEEETEKEEENEVEEGLEATSQAPVKDSNLKWIIVLGVGLFLSFAFLIGGIILIWWSCRSKAVEKPAQPPQIPEAIVPKSPAPTSPIVMATSPMPTESPSNVAPSTVKTDALRSRADNGRFFEHSQGRPMRHFSLCFRSAFLRIQRCYLRLFVPVA